MSDGWLVSDAVKVEISSLLDFAKAIEQERTGNFEPSMKRGIEPLAGLQAPFGRGGIQEGLFFDARHGENSGALAQLLGDALQGLRALQTAASSIAAEYGDADALSAAEQNTVFDAFYPLDSNQTLQGDIEKARAQESGAKDEGDTVLPAGVTDPANYFGSSGTGSEPGGTAGSAGPYDPQVISSGTTWQVDLTDNEAVHRAPSGGPHGAYSPVED